MGYLFPNGLQPGKQKAAWVAELLGLVPLKEQVAVERVGFFVRDNGLAFTPEMEQAIKDLAKPDEGKKKLLEALATHRPESGAPKLLKDLFPDKTFDLKYDPAALEEGVGRALEKSHLELTYEVKGFLKKLDANKVKPDFLKSQLARLESYGAKRVFQDIAHRSGLPAVTPTVAPKSAAKALKQSLASSWVVASSEGEVSKYLKDAIAGGADDLAVNRFLQELADKPEAALARLKASARRDPPKLALDMKKRDAEAENVLAQNMIKLTPELQGLLHKIVEDKTVSDARAWIASLASYEPEDRIRAEAKRKNLEVPAFEYDLDRVHGDFRTLLSGLQIAYTDELKGFLEARLKEGVGRKKLRTFIGYLNQYDVSQALRAAGVTLPDGVQAPKVEWDLAAVHARMEQQLISQGDTVAYSDEMRKFTEKKLKEGVKPPTLSTLLQLLPRVHAEAGRELRAPYRGVGREAPEGGREDRSARRQRALTGRQQRRSGEAQEVHRRGAAQGH